MTTITLKYVICNVTSLQGDTDRAIIERDFYHNFPIVVDI